jgi:hypothetical protein
LLRFELRLVGVPLCPAWLSLFMRRGETDGQIFFNHHNEGIPMSEQNTHHQPHRYPQFLGPRLANRQGGTIYGMTATNSPDDNKLRLTSASRLDRTAYDRVKEAGFLWAPKLEQFIAPKWPICVLTCAWYSPARSATRTVH